MTDRTPLPPMAAQVLRFGLVGSTQSVVNVAAFAWFLHVGVPYWLAAIAAGAIALILSFFLHRSWTFTASQSGEARHQLRRYLVTYACATALGVALLALLVQAAHAPEVLSQAVAVVMVAPLSYVAQRWWTFA